MKLRISERVLDHLSGSQSWQCPDDEREEPETLALMTRLREAELRKDGSYVGDFTDGEMWTLHLFVSTMADGAADNVGSPRDPYYDGDALADLNSARALCRKIEAAGVRT